jgi:hypothetical protein
LGSHPNAQSVDVENVPPPGVVRILNGFVTPAVVMHQLGTPPSRLQSIFWEAKIDGFRRDWRTHHMTGKKAE